MKQTPNVGDTVILKPMIVARVFEDGSFYCSLDGGPLEATAAKPEHIARIESRPPKVGDTLRHQVLVGETLHLIGYDNETSLWWVKRRYPSGHSPRVYTATDLSGWERV